ncbi:endonuclease/exonuclease/phosphatase family protein [Brevibacillus invocatus]|uniref:endonuclease/exonuclease/phosphatase family protein n=1 Tax=Brevibacillus invocatus TaxID=173959 RepID=UPI0023EEAC4A|nr:endonuclease/exonuclease/phosphatase family protein [Brevibacillus invocatus]
MIRAVSYNIHSGRDLFWRKRLDQMAASFQEWNADVICLQEVHQNSKYGYQARFLADQLRYQFLFAPSIQIADGFYGNAILTRLACTRFQTVFLPAKKEKRTLLQASLVWQGREFLVWNTHCSLQATSRSSQLQLLRTLARQEQETPLLLFGDFNAPNITFAPLLRDCAWELGKESLPTLPAFRRRLDYIFASPHWQVHDFTLSNIAWSDHVPVIAELDWRERPHPVPVK